MQIEGVMRELAAKQQGVIGVWQARAHGLTANELYRLRRSDRWQPKSDRVLAVVGAPETPHQLVMAGVLDASPDAAVSGATGAWLWGAPGFDPVPPEVVRPRGISRRGSELAVIHEVVDLNSAQIKVLGGIPVASPARVVCELAATHPWRAERVLDRFWSDGLLDGRTFRRTVQELADSGRAGSTLFRELDAARGPGYVPPASGLEARFLQICPWPMRRQVNSGKEEWCGRVDFRDIQVPLIVEVQSERHHTALVDQADDAARRGRLTQAGFTIVEVWDTEVWHRPDVAVERIRAARRPLLARVA